jgi:hypothetical protein
MLGDATIEVTATSWSSTSILPLPKIFFDLPLTLCSLPDIMEHTLTK